MKIACLMVAAGAAMGQQPGNSALDLSGDLNRELPKWLRFSGEYRSRFEGFSGLGFKRDNSDDYLLSRLRLNMLLQPTPWLKVFAQGQDARVFVKDQKPAAPPYRNTWDLRQAYLELGDSEKKGFGLRVGRQEINLGEQRPSWKLVCSGL